MIKPQPPPRSAPSESTRVDGMANAIVPTSVGSDYAWTGITPSELHEAYIVKAGSEAFAFIKNERNCWICKGYGHTKDKCPSDPRVKRPIAGVIQGLTALQSAEQARFRNFRPRRVVIRRNGRSPASPATAHEAALTISDNEVVYQYDDGAIFSDHGEMLSPPINGDDDTHSVPLIDGDADVQSPPRIIS